MLRIKQGGLETLRRDILIRVWEGFPELERKEDLDLRSRAACKSSPFSISAKNVISVAGTGFSKISLL